MLIVSSDEMLLQCTNPHNKRILRRLSKDNILKNIFFVKYFQYELYKLAPWRYSEVIASYYHALENSTDVDSFCDCLQEMLGRISEFPIDVQCEKERFEDVFIYLSNPFSHLLAFIKKYDVFEKNDIDCVEQRVLSLQELYINLWEELMKCKVFFDEYYAFLNAEFSSYRKSKRGNPILRAISQFAGGFVGGYLGSSLGFDINGSLGVGEQFGQVGEELMDLFTSDSRNDKITAYESMVDAVINYIYKLREIVDEEVLNIIDEINDLMSSVENGILDWMKKNNFHRKSIAVLMNETNYIYIFDGKTNRKYCERDEVLEQLRKSGIIKRREKRRIKKLFYKYV